MIHPYTKKLLSSTEAYEEELDEEKQAEIIWMNLGVQKEGYNGCPYCSRCPHATQKCEEERPEMVEFERGIMLLVIGLMKGVRHNGILLEIGAVSEAV